MRTVLNQLVDRGLRINPEMILDKYNHYIAINHVIDDILTMNSNQTNIKKVVGKNFREEDVIREFFYDKKYEQLKESFIDIERVFKLRKIIGGQIILCHPAKFQHIKRPFLEKLKKMGLDGVEMFSPHHSYGAVMYIQFLANEYNFIATGGSDFHRFEGSSYQLQDAWEYFKIDSKYLRNIKKIIGKA
jgi:predicted metal-dependent phosphoesterase TrpH